MSALQSEEIEFGSSAIPVFKEQFPWWGPHLQTLRWKIGPGPPSLSDLNSQQFFFPLEDGSGDELAAYLINGDITGRPLVLLVHGLGGSAESAYVRASAGFFKRAGYRVLVVSMRGAGASGPRCRNHNHPGRDEDLDLLLSSIQERRPDLIEDGVVLAGYSLGGNIVLKFLGNLASGFPLCAALAVSAPLDLAAASRSLGRWKNWPYQLYLLRRLRREVLRDGGWLSEEQREKIRGAESIWELDETVTAPYAGYAGAQEFYDQNSCRRFLSQIQVPTLIVYSRDDPVIPAQSYDEYDWDGNSCLHPRVTRSGGHVGFHCREGCCWHDLCLLKLLEKVC